MSRWIRLAPVVWLAACAPPDATFDDLDPDPAWDLPTDAPLGAPPADFTLTAGNAVAGEVLELAIDGAPPSSVVRLVVGTGGLADGPCPAALGGPCLSLGGRTNPLRWVFVTDAAGSVRLGVIVPRARAGAYLSAQAVALGGTAELSNPIGRFVGPAGSPLGEGDEDGDGYTIRDGDCADFRADVGPAMPDPLGDGVDWNCDDSDGDDSDGDGLEDVASGGPDCDDTRADVGDAPERCDGLDNDCDGDVDVGAPGDTVFYADADGDTYGNPTVSVTSCVAPAGFTSNPWDCNDGASGVGICGSCKAVYDSGGSSGDGVYYLKPCAGAGTPTAYWCDMGRGGWTVGGWMPSTGTHTLGVSNLGTVGGSDWSKDLACVPYTEAAVFNRTNGDFFTTTVPASTWAFTTIFAKQQTNGRGFVIGTYGGSRMMGCLDYQYNGAYNAGWGCDNDSQAGQRGHIADYAGEYCSGGRLDNTWAWTNGSTCSLRGQAYTWGIAIR